MPIKFFIPGYQGGKPKSEKEIDFKDINNKPDTITGSTLTFVP